MFWIRISCGKKNYRTSAVKKSNGPIHLNIFLLTRLRGKAFDEKHFNPVSYGRKKTHSRFLSLDLLHHAHLYHLHFDLHHRTPQVPRFSKKKKLKFYPKFFILFSILGPQNFFFFFNLAPLTWGLAPPLSTTFIATPRSYRSASS